MGGKHLKRLRAEKSKVQLKKKILPKGQNITNTTFTVKKIIAVEQLKKVDENEPVSNWNVPLKDLLIRLNHYSFTSRLNSLNGIKDLISKHPEILKGPSLKTIIEKLLELITDVEHKIRITAITLLSSIFAFIPPASAVSFNEIAVVYLGCAMTHRTVSIQHDSLKFVNVIIKYLPGAVKLNFKSMTQNFSRILKSYLHECHSGLHLSKGSQYFEKVKTEMLFTFYQFLTAGFSNTVAEEFGNFKHDVNILNMENVSLRDTSDQYKQIPSLSMFSKLSENKESSLTQNDFEEFKSLSSLVMPLVFETWLEFSPSQIASECVLTEGIGELFSVLLKIIMLFSEKAVSLKNEQMEYWFVSNYGPAFKKAFLFSFPYLSVTRKRSKANQCSEFSEGRCNDAFLLENLMICILSYSFNIVPKRSPLEKKIEDYIISALMKNQSESKILIKAVNTLMNLGFAKSKTFLNSVVVAHNATNNLELKQGLSKELMQLVLQENDATYLEDNSIIQWMQHLTECLCKSQIFMHDIEAVMKLITKSVGNEILKEIGFRGEKIIKNLSGIKAIGAPQFEGQKQIVNILYKCDIKVIEELVKNTSLIESLQPPELRNYVMDIFSQKLKDN